MEKKYVNFEVLSDDSEEVRELQERWEGGDRRYEDESYHEYSGYKDTGVYAFLNRDGEPFMYVLVKTDIEYAYGEYRGNHYQIEASDGTVLDKGLSYDEAKNLAEDYILDDGDEFYFIRNFLTYESETISREDL